MAQLKVSSDVVCSPGHSVTVGYNQMVNEESYPLVIIAKKGDSISALMVSDAEIENIYHILGAYRALKGIK